MFIIIIMHSINHFPQDLKKRLREIIDVLEESSSSSSSSLYQISRIVGVRATNEDELLYLVHWDGYDSEDDTWEPMHKLIDDGCEELIADFHEKVNRQI